MFLGNAAGAFTGARGRPCGDRRNGGGTRFARFVPRGGRCARTSFDPEQRRNRRGRLQPLPPLRMSAVHSDPTPASESRRAPTIVQLVGGTPLVRIRRIATPAHIRIFAKLEYFNPGGSVKDRPALQMVLDALADGRLTPEKTLIDSTSGNTGVAYSWIGAAMGFPVALVMPANVSIARKRITTAYGAQIVYSDPMEGSDGAIRKVRR